MKRGELYKICVTLLIMSLLSLTLVSARKGVGLVWSTETEVVHEGGVHCVEYGVYNPWDEDVRAVLGVSDNLRDVIVREESEVKLVGAGTLHDVAVPFEFCFRVGKVYDADCLFGGLVCRQDCLGEEVVFDGKVMVLEESGSSGGGTGSATSLGVGVPLKLRVKCVAHGRDWGLVYLLVVLVCLVWIGVLLHGRFKHHRRRR